MEYHKPVLLQSCIEHLNIQATGTYIDLTFGGGGHSRVILEHLNGGRLFAFDQDPDAAKNALDHPSFTLVQSNFRFLQKQMRFHGITEVDGILGDLGVSSHQIDIPQRGFSLRYDAPLDMRMNPAKPFDAKTLLNTYDEAQLFSILKNLGELSNAKILARALVQYRASHALETTHDLKAALSDYEPKLKPFQFWAKVFQALRMEVNDEMGALHDMLEQATELLKPGGRLVIMSYHSLEDRPVKNYMRYGNIEGEPQKDFYGNLLRPLVPITKKPLVADSREVQENPRARSAKLRVAEKNVQE